jgi:hypothetical protein
MPLGAHDGKAGDTDMATYENAPPLEGWELPERYHCGDWCVRDCPTCGFDAILHPQIPPNVELGAE